MNKFSDESQFILKNWERIQDLVKAVQICRSEMGAYLASLETILQNQPWWQKELTFVKIDDTQCYISRENWADTDDYVVWIGVEGFRPEAIFGGLGASSSYLWLSKRAAELADPITAYVKKDLELNDLVVSGTSGQKTRYLLKKKLRRWYPEELDEFSADGPLNEIADFMGKVYAAIQDYELPGGLRGYELPGRS